MAEPTGLAAIGRVLQEVLASAYEPPAGARVQLGFLPAVPIRPEQFTNDGVINSLLVSNALRPITNSVTVVANGQCVGLTLGIDQLYGSLLGMAKARAKVGSETGNAFAALVSGAAATYGPLGTRHDATTSPDRWFEAAANDEGWLVFEQKSSTGSQTSESSSSGTDIPALDDPAAPDLWQWRTVDPATLSLRPAIVDLIPPPRPIEVTVENDHSWAKEITSDTIDLSQLVVENASVFSAVEESPVLDTAIAAQLTAPMSFASGFATKRALTSQVDQMVFLANEAVVSNLAGEVSEEIAIAPAQEHLTFASRDLLEELTVAMPNVLTAIDTGEASATQHIESSELSLSMRYSLVQLTRSEWWNDMWLRRADWYAPGVKRGEIVPGTALTARDVGIPVALVLTKDVKISGTWTEVDKSAAASHTSIGPWQINDSHSEFHQDGNATTLAIPGIQIVGLVCQMLPTLPPIDDPDPTD